MQFPFRRMSTRRPVPPLGGVSFRYKPLLHATAAGPAGSLIHLCMVDSGADDSIFPEATAHALGIDLTNAPEGDAVPIGGQPVTYRFAPLRLSVSDGTQRCEWEALVGFIARPLRYAFLGLTGFFQFFDVTLSAEKREFVVVPSPSFPGIISLPPSGGP